MPVACSGPLCQRALTLRSSTIDEGSRSIEAIIATENPVWAFDQRRQRRIHEVLLMSGAEIPDQIPLLDSHDQSSVASVHGSIRHMRVDGQSMIGRLYFSEDNAGLRSWQLVRDGHLTDISVGSQHLETVVIDPGRSETINGQTFTAGDDPMFIRTRWRPREGSLVAIGADEDAKTLRCACGSCGQSVRTLADMLFDLAMQDVRESNFDHHIVTVVSDMARRAGISFDYAAGIVLGDELCDDETVIRAFADELYASPDALLAVDRNLPPPRTSLAKPEPFEFAA